ncbi:hypothetical protein DIZ76_015370 [Coccidioides immitis]|nr:hypothetical protein DIZ76_015370 [Coccidioides immitis]
MGQSKMRTSTPGALPPFRSLPAFLLIVVLFLNLLSPTSASLLHDQDHAGILHPEITAYPVPSAAIDADPLTISPPDLRKRSETDDDDGESNTSTRSRQTSPTATITDSSGSSPSPSSPSTSRPSAIRPSVSGSPSSEIIASTPTVPDGPLPSAFDTSIGGNAFSTKSCTLFFDDFLGNSTFNECLPLSLLLTTSTSFFNAAKSVVTLTRVLDASCSVDAVKCTELLSHFGREVGSKAACDKDLAAENPLVLQARNGFVAYKFVHDATCLKNPDTGSYCLADAVTSEQAADAFIYHLAVGAALPGSTRPQCNKCLQATMEVYSQGAGIGEQPLSLTYKPAAKQINIGCGPGFVSESVRSGAAALSALLSRSLSLYYLSLPLTLLVFDGFQ